MKLVIPATTLEISRIHLSPFEESTHKNGTPIAPLSYNDPFFKMKDIEIITPPLVVDSYDVSAGKISFKVSSAKNTPVGIFGTKITTLQEYIISTLHLHQSSVLGRTDLKRELIESCFQKICDGEKLNLFIAQNDTRTPVFHNSEEKPQFGLAKNLGSDIVGKRVRILLKISGVRVLSGNPYRFRLHHTLMNVYVVNE